MKRFWSMLLCLAMVLSLGVTALAAEPVEEEISLLPDNAEPLSYTIGSGTRTPAVDLPQESATSTGNGLTLVEPRVSEEEIDFSSAILIAGEVSDNSIMTADVADNQAPVGKPSIFVINPESMIDGQYTTATIFYIATRWNNQDLCYDPEGGPLFLATNNFPAGYITELNDEDYGTYAGYAVRIFNRGSYFFQFAISDMYNGMTPVTSLNLNIISRGVFETIDGSLTSATAVDRHSITVDYTNTDTYCLSLLRKGTGGFKVTVYDENGTQCGTSTVSDLHTGNRAKGAIELKRPEGVTGSYSYSVSVAAVDKYFSAGDTTYRLAYGAEDQKVYFFEDVSDSIELPYYVPYRDMLKDHDYRSICDLTPSDYGDYYKITTKGPETITLTQRRDYFRFKILSTSTFETLYDSRDLQPYDPYGSSSSVPFECISVKVNFTPGESYYVVVYSPEGVGAPYGYEISVGDRQLISRSAEYTIPEMSFVKGTPRMLNFKLTPVTGLSGYVNTVDYSAHTATAYNMHGSQFSVLSPGTSTWRTNVPHTRSIDFGFKSGQPLVNCGGTWQLRLTPTESGTYPGAKITVYYMCEI
ncbi:hypothetical protein D1159_17605 [Pseudoflavonifractor sp. 524-17]|uniref:hypothetical protein n=1 Tax=Pseudoflavonifractor sp. 524-17 TaxID=2304577 RepID=UPI00137AFD49|nr:hypothetical protein [Pseudoflavonifractor sp. 524-17]NCE66335.1 hypothetical protein [Pseudoflavonifractor sp. 524-17]